MMLTFVLFKIHFSSLFLATRLPSFHAFEFARSLLFGFRTRSLLRLESRSLIQFARCKLSTEIAV